VKEIFLSKTWKYPWERKWERTNDVFHFERFWWINKSKVNKINHRKTTWWCGV